MRNMGVATALLALSLCLAGCNTDQSAITPDPNAPKEPPAGGGRRGGFGGPATAGGFMSQPKSSLKYQLELLQKGDVKTLRGCFTRRVRDEITDEAVAKAKGKAAKATIEQLYVSEEPGEVDGNKTIKVKMKDGKTLTTLVQMNGRWLSDTVWFK